MSNTRWHVMRREQTLVIEGEITLATISPVLAAIMSLIQDEPPKDVDLSHLRLCDSSAVALVLELQRHGGGHVLHAPPAFSAVVRACQLDALFPYLAQNHSDS
ncbi:MAG TPA: STAS domain-containing protein [bacterium]|nr:STAS domain-containing protein [bacterium]